MKLLFAASECAPFIKTGGLADVVGALPKALMEEGAEVSVVLPKYGDIAESFREKMKHLDSIKVSVGWRQQYCGIEKTELDGISYFFLDNEYYFKRQGSYGFHDDGERFAFFSRAVLEALPCLMEDPPDLIHCHDWQTGPISVLLEADYRKHRYYENIKTVFTIHNLRYQGVYPKEVHYDLLGLTDSYFHSEGLEFYGNVSYLKAGLAYADVITTVSPTYADEIQTPYYGENLDGFLRKRKGSLRGIINGIDLKDYNPARDPNLYFQYEHPEGKRENKVQLQNELALSENAEIPVIAMITRLVDQKGLDLVLHVFREILDLNVQFILLGTGDADYEQAFREHAETHPDKVSANFFFDESLARKIYAGSDLFLMPSKFEPCGIGQLIAMRYGSLPIVRETGGLKDTVIPYNEFSDEGYAFRFSNFNAHDMLYTVERAVWFYRYQPKIWAKLVSRTMKKNFGWKASAKAYQDLYEEVLEQRKSSDKL
ncbi:MAG TPA: glycogen synthase GlgA [Bacillales bacterium]|nr:glycogen synthase GlgA [Bacillales bacterium]